MVAVRPGERLSPERLFYLSGYLVYTGKYKWSADRVPYVMRELLMNAAEGDMLTVVYDKTAMNGVNEYEEEMTVKVTDANPYPPGLMDKEAVVAVVSVNDNGDETKNAGYIGMNALGGCEMKPDNSYFPSESVKSLSGGEA